MRKSLVLAMFTAFFTSFSAVLAEGEMTVSGVGVVPAKPDMATISLGVTTEGRAATIALKSNNDAMAAVLASLTAAGVAEADLQTSGLSVQPRWDNYRSGSSGQPKITGFVASNQLSVRIRDLSKLGAILDQVAEDGANAFNGLSFGLQDPGPVEDEARKLAVADAIAKAELYATAAGIALGPLIRFNEGTVQVPQPMARMQMAEAASSGVPVAGGEVTIRANVTMVFDIGG